MAASSPPPTLLLFTLGRVPSALFNAWLLGARLFSVCVLRAKVELLVLSNWWWLLSVPFSLTLEARAVVAVSDNVGLRSPEELL